MGIKGLHRRRGQTTHANRDPTLPCFARNSGAHSFPPSGMTLREETSDHRSLSSDSRNHHWPDFTPPQPAMKPGFVALFYSAVYTLDYHDVAKEESLTGNHPQVPEFRFNRRYLCVCVGYLMATAAEGPEKFTEMYEYAMSQLWRYRQRRKPGRTFERIAKSPNSKWKRSTYNTKAKANK